VVTRIIVAAATVVALVALLVRFDAIGPGDGTAPPAPFDSGLADLARLDRSKFTDAAPLTQAVRTFEGRVEENPCSVIDYTLFGQLLIRHPRANVDPGALTRAEASLARAPAFHPEGVPAQAQYATVFPDRHRFSEAIEVAERALGRGTNAQAVARLADARFAIGDDGAARAGYLRLNSIAPGPIAQARAGQVEYLRGDVDGALRLMQSAVVDEYEAGASAEGLARYAARIGDLYQGIGNRVEAGAHYRPAIDLFPRHLDEAVDLYRGAIEVAPDPTLVAEFGDLDAAMGRHGDAQIQCDTVLAIGRLNASQASVIDRALEFLADHELDAGEALRLAQADSELRQDVHARDPLAWALYRKGRYEQAAAASERALAFGTGNAAFHFHAALIYEALGDSDPAVQAWAAVARTNPRFSLLHAEWVQAGLACLPVAAR